MDIEAVWNATEKQDALLQHMLEIRNLQRLHSHHPMMKLRQSLLMGLYWAIPITLGYLCILFWFPVWQVRVTMMIMILFNLWLSLGGRKLYRDIPSSISPEISLKSELERNYWSFMRWLKLQERAGIFVYPFAATGGFILGWTSGSGKPVEGLFSSSTQVMIMGIIVLAAIPCCYYLTRTMLNRAYGRHLERLKELIDEMEG